MLKSLLNGPVKHEVKVTRIKGVGYGVRVLVNGKINQQDIGHSQADIGQVARSMLRMEDKCGNLSDFARRARMRPGKKELRRKP